MSKHKQLLVRVCDNFYSNTTNFSRHGDVSDRQVNFFHKLFTFMLHNEYLK